MYVPCATVSRIAPVVDTATCAHGWLCGSTCVSAERCRIFARTGRAGPGTNRCGVSESTYDSARCVRGARGVGSGRVPAPGAESAVLGMFATVFGRLS